MRSQMDIAKREARQKTELLETEKELHANLKQSQSLKQREIEQINEEILDLKEQLEKVKTETEPQIQKNTQAAEVQDKFHREFVARLRNMEAGKPDEKFVSELLEPHISAMDEETSQWLKDNGYAPILPVDIQKWQL